MCEGGGTELAKEPRLTLGFAGTPMSVSALKRIWPVLIVPEVHSAEVALVPWSSPCRRPDAERPLVTVDLPEPSDPEAGDEEA